MSFPSPKTHISGSPHSDLEQQLIREYLRDKGFSRQDLHKLPKDDANALLGQARRYATLKLAEIEARARFRHKIRFEN